MVYRGTGSEASACPTQGANPNRGIPSVFDGFPLQPSVPVQSSNVGEMEKGASLAVKNIGKPCTGEPYARFDEGALRMKRLLEHVVAACGKASVKEPGEPVESVPYSTRNLSVPGTCPWLPAMNHYKKGLGF